MVTRARARGGVLAVCVLVVGSGTAAASVRTAVLRGTVLAAPSAPVCMPRVPCLRPAAGVTLAFSRGGVVRARPTTAVDGSYRVALAPGTYRIRVARPAGVGRLTPSIVAISRGEVKRVTLYLDTGIR